MTPRYTNFSKENWEAYFKRIVEGVPDLSPRDFKSERDLALLMNTESLLAMAIANGRYKFDGCVEFLRLVNRGKFITIELEVKLKLLEKIFRLYGKESEDFKPDYSDPSSYLFIQFPFLMPPYGSGHDKCWGITGPCATMILMRLKIDPPIDFPLITLYALHKYDSIESRTLVACAEELVSSRNLKCIWEKLEDPFKISVEDLNNESLQLPVGGLHEDPLQFSLEGLESNIKLSPLRAGFIQRNGFGPEPNPLAVLPYTQCRLKHSGYPYHPSPLVSISAVKGIRQVLRGRRIPNRPDCNRTQKLQQFNSDYNCILTPSIDLERLKACLEQFNRYNGGDYDDLNFLWITWYGFENGAAEVDWTPLSGKRVFYILTGHDCLPLEKILSTAELVLRKLKEAGVKEIRFVNCLYLPKLGVKEGPLDGRKEPFLQSVDDFKVYEQSLRNDGLIHLYSTPFNTKPPPQRLGDFFLIKSISLLFGDADLQTLALSLAYFISQGMSFDEAPKETCNPESVLYLRYEGNDKKAIRDQMSILLRLHLSKLPNFVEPLGSSDLENALESFIEEFVGERRHGPSYLCNYPRSSLSRPGYSFDGTEESLNSELKKNFKTQKFYYVAVPADLATSPDDIIYDIKRIKKMMQECKYPPRFVVLDGLPSFDRLLKKAKKQDQKLLEEFSSFCDFIKKSDASLLIVTSKHSSEMEKVENLASLPFNDLIQADTELTPRPEDIGYLIRVHKCKWRKQKFNYPNLFTLEFSPSTPIPTWSYLKKPLSVSRKHELVKEFYDEHFSWKDIAFLLLSMEKRDQDVLITENIDKKAQSLRKWASERGIVRKRRGKQPSCAETNNLLQKFLPKRSDSDLLEDVLQYFRENTDMKKVAESCDVTEEDLRELFNRAIWEAGHSSSS